MSLCCLTFSYLFCFSFSEKTSAVPPDVKIADKQDFLFFWLLQAYWPIQALPGIICVLAWMEMNPFLFLKVFHKVLARCLVWVISQHPWSTSTERNWFFSGSAGAVSLPQFFSPCVHGSKSRHMAFRNFSMHVHF